MPNRRRRCPQCKVGTLKHRASFVQDGESKVLIACTNCLYTEVQNAEPNALREDAE